MEARDTPLSEFLVRLLSRHQEDLFRYIFALLPHEEDARDVLQETCVSLFRKFSEYDLNKPFLPWAYRFAYLEILKQRERNQRGIRLLKLEVLERLAQEREQQDALRHERLQALESCLQALPQKDQELIRQRYHHHTRTDEMARMLGASRRTLFRELDRIRTELLDCITRRLAAVELP